MTPEQRQRLNNAMDNIQAARLLAESGFFDIAVSRAYYAMLYSAEALLLIHGLRLTQHEAVSASFEAEFATVPSLVCYHPYLADGYRARIVADYSPLVKSTLPEAACQINHAQTFFETAESYLQQLAQP
ncbi:MAG: HEPN domain-containing protein [Cyanobacteria bacterium P01_A01_bin.114]